MALPTSRPRTYAAGSQVFSADLNDLNDAVIGKKFPSTEFFIPGSEFVIDGGAPTRSGHVWTFSASAGGSVIAPLVGWPWVTGTRITDVVWSYNRNSTPITGEIDFSLPKRSFGDGGATGANVTSSIVSSGNTWTTNHMNTSLPYVIEANFEYLLKMLTTNLTFSATPFFDGVKIVADRL